MVTERTKSFPTERCKELMEHYPEVVKELKQIDEMGGPEMMMGGQGAPPGMPQGMPPGMPQGMPPGMPQGMPPDMQHP
jgi:pre-mRNA 3'-end-processing factor FIP1